VEGNGDDDDDADGADQGLDDDAAGPGNGDEEEVRSGPKGDDGSDEENRREALSWWPKRAPAELKAAEDVEDDDGDEDDEDDDEEDDDEEGNDGVGEPDSVVDDDRARGDEEKRVMMGRDGDEASRKLNLQRTINFEMA
jgi:hypothetical protein